MVVLLVVSFVLVGTAFVGVRLSRRRDDSMLRHQRALAALCDAERQHRSTEVETTPISALTDHVHMVDAPSADRVATRRRRRAPARRPATGRRRKAAEIAALPTIAQLPTASFGPTVWLPAPAPEPAPAELMPDGVATIEADVPDWAG